MTCAHFTLYNERMLTNRSLVSKINKLKKSCLLVGPRQTGKSTLMRSLDPDLEIDLADEETFVQYLSDPGRIKSAIVNKQKIFIDEIQRIPSLLNTIQSILDKNKNLQFLLTGSSARKLKRGKANLLPGRILTYEIGPLTHLELGKDFNLDKAFSTGLLPGIYWEESLPLAQKTLRSYAVTYLKEEIQAEALTRNLEGFSRFFQVAASRSGDFTDFSKMASQAMIERTSARRYFEILVDTLVVYEVEAFSKSAKRRLIQHPRYYFFDVGVLNGCLGNFVTSPDRIGVLFEHLFLQLLLSSAKAADEEIRASVYKTDSGAEVDFIVEKGNHIYAIELKASKNVGKSDIRGLKSFQDFYKKPCELFVAYLGNEDLSIEGVSILPFLKVLKEIGY